MPRRTRVLPIILTLVLAFSTEALAQDIINPVPGYRQIKRTSEDQPRDSIKTCEAFFEALPRFGEPASVVFTYYSQFDSEAGLEVMARSETFTTLDINPYIVTIPGPVARGDTIQCRFQIVPRSVGYIDLSFIVYDPTNKLVKAPVRVGALVYTKMLLAPSGQTIALATPACSRVYGPILGPNPELLEKGVIFALDPKLPIDLRPPDYDRSFANRPETYWYDVRLEVAREPGTGHAIINGTLSPYHSLNAGIGIEVRHSANQVITRLSPSIQGPVIKDGKYDFYIEVEASSELEIGVLIIGFSSPNPDFGSTDGFFSSVNSELLSRSIALYTGFDELGNLSFVTDTPPWTNLEYRQKQGIETKFSDDRLELVRTHKRPRTQGDVIYSENYDKVMSFYSQESH